MAKANALLNAVVDSIESPKRPPPSSLPVEESSLAVPTSSDIEQSSPMRRNRALAEALFGAEELHTAASLAPQISIMPDMGSLSSPEDEDEPLQAVLAPIKPLQTPKRSDSLRHATSPTAPTSPPANTMPTSPGGLLSPLSPTAGMSSAQLAFEVQRRAEAATAALRKSPSIPKMNEGGGTVTRKRISPNKISAPTLVSASTSVDAIPLISPTATPTPASGQQSSKIGSRFKKLRGTIRAKHAPMGDEITPYPLELRRPGTADSQSPMLSTSNLALKSEPLAIPSSASAAEPRFKAPAPLPSPPASATPGLKGFMARFRKQRATAVPEHLTPPALVVPPPAHPEVHALPTSATSTKSAGLPFGSGSPDQLYPAMPQSAPALQTMFRSVSPLDQSRSPPSQSPTPRPGSQPLTSMMAPRLPVPQAHSDEDALKQLFDAANNLGLDQAALNDLIARSPSTSSRSTAWTRLTRATSPNDSRKSGQLPIIHGRMTPESVRSPPMSEGRPSLDGFSPRPSAEIKSSRRKSQDPPPRARQQQQQYQDAAGQQEPRPNTIVRRTIIVPSDARISTMDLNALMRKHSTSRRRASVSSGRSIHDRVPTPPPPHRGGVRRFSTDAASPPMPLLPPSLSVQTEGMLSVPSPLEKSTSSAYDSL